MKMIDIAVECFEKSLIKELHVNEVSETAFRLYPNEFANQNDAKKKINSALSSNAKSKNSLFSKPKNKKTGKFRKGYYKLKKQKPKIHQLDFNVYKETATKQNTGRGGEFAVISELIFNGHNATLMPVDNGIDVISTKDEKFYHIQVKTRIVEKFGIDVSFSIKKSIYNANSRSNDYYIFVLRTFKKTKWENEYIVLHSSQLETNAAETKNANINVKFTFKDKRIFLGGTEVTGSFNNFEKIS